MAAPPIGGTVDAAGWRSPVWRAAVVLAAGVWGIGWLISSTSGAATGIEHTFDLTIDGQPGGTNAVDFDGMTFGQVTETLEQLQTAATTGGTTPHADVSIAPDGFTSLTATDARVWWSIPQLGDPASEPLYLVSFMGQTQMLGHEVEFLAMARWTSPDDTKPVMDLAFRFGEVDLSEFAPSPGFEVDFSDAWMFVARAAVSEDANQPHDIDPAKLPDAEKAFFDDGVANNDDKILGIVPTGYAPAPTGGAPAWNSEGVTFRGLLDPDGLVAQTAGAIGLAGDVRVDGTVATATLDRATCTPGSTGQATCTNTNLATKPAAATGLNLVATMPIDEDAETALPPIVKVDSAWVFKLFATIPAGGSGSDTAVSLKGGVVADPTPDEFINLNGEIALQRAAGAPTHSGGTTTPGGTLYTARVTLTAENIENFLDVHWLDMEEFALSFEFSVQSRKAPTTTSTTISTPTTGATTTTTPTTSGGHAFVLTGSSRVDLSDLTGNETDRFDLELSGGYSTTNGFQLTLSAALSSIPAINVSGALQRGASAPSLLLTVRDVGLAIQLRTMPPGTTGNACSSAGGTNTSSTTTTMAGAPPLTACGPDVTVTVTGAAEVSLRDEASLAAEVLFKIRQPLGATPAGGGSTTTTTGGAGSSLPTPDVLFVARPNAAHDDGGLTWGKLTGHDVGIDDWELPSADLSFATTDWHVLPQYLDAATAAFTSGERLLVRSGITISAKVPITGSLGTALKEIGVDVSQPVAITGKVPIWGSPEVGIIVELPEIQRPTPQPGDSLPGHQIFKRASLNFMVGNFLLDAANPAPCDPAKATSNCAFRVLLAGKATVEVPHATSTEPICAHPTHESYAATCTDTMEFSVSGSYDKTSTQMLLDFRGEFNAPDGWQEPFGIKNLTVHHVALAVGITVPTPVAGHPTTAVPAVHAGLTGSVTVSNGRGEKIDFTLAFLLKVTPKPPFITPVGFTFASDGFGLYELVDLYNLMAADEAEIDRAALAQLPNVRLEDVYVAYGLVQDNTLCIREGFFVAAELHVGGTPAGQVPACNGQNDLIPATAPDPSEDCKSSDSCLAAVLIDIQIGASITTIANSKVQFEGYFAPAELGPLHLDEFKVELELSPSRQFFHLSGGAALVDPFHVGPGESVEVAAGDFLIELSAGSMRLQAEVSFFDNGIVAGVEGTAGLSFTDPQFDLDVWFRAPALVELVETIAAEFEKLGATVETLAGVVEDAAKATVADVEQALTDLVAWGEEAADTATATLASGLLDGVKGARAFFDSVNSVLISIDLDPIDTDAILDAALHGYSITIGPIDGIWVGPVCMFVVGADGHCYIFEGATMTFAGLCDAEVNRDEAICREGTTPEQAVIDMAVKQFEQAATAPAIGLDLDEFDQEPKAILEQLDDVLDGDTGVAARCAATTFDYATGTKRPVEIELNAGATTTSFTAGLDLTSGEVDPDGEVFQSGVESLVGDEVDTPLCDRPMPAFLQKPRVTIEVDGDESITEGAFAAVEGTADESPVTVDWGDGATEMITVADGAWSASHRYADDGSYRIEASAGGSEAVTAIVVTNVAPTFTVSIDDPLTEGQANDLVVTIKDVGVEDTHKVTVIGPDAGAGTHVSLAPGGGTLRIPVSWIDEEFPGGASVEHGAVERPLRVTVSDGDGGRTGTETSATVVNDAPTIGELSIVSVEPPLADGPSGLVVNEGAIVQMNLEFEDSGLADFHDITVDWGDGSENTQWYPAALALSGVLDRGDAGATRNVMLAHAWADEDPTGTPEDSYTVTVTVSDDDGGVHTETFEVLVRNVAPVVEALTVSAATHAENETAVTLDVAFSDASLLDSHTVTVDWGEGWSKATSSGTDVSGEDARTTVVEVAAPGAAATPEEVDAGRTVSATNRYGDDSTYVIGVTIVDDDTGIATGSWTLRVVSVDPTHALNDSVADGATTTAGGQTFIAGVGENVTISDTATDPGSDDLSFGWDFGDGAGASNHHRAGTPVAGVDEARPSPQVAPREVTDTVTRGYRAACLYGVSVHVTDDDGGDGGTDHVAVVVQRVREPGDDRQRNHGQWRDAITTGAVSVGELACYLDVAGHLSAVLVGASELAGRPWAPLVGTEDVTMLDEDGVPVVLTRQPRPGLGRLEDEHVKLDRSLLSAWLNFADGAWVWDTLIEDTDGDGVLDASFARVMAEIEAVRLDSSDWKEVRDARQRLWQLGFG